MARINLLPWRETLRQEKQQELAIVTGIAVVFTAAIMGLVHMQINSMIDFQTQKNNYLKQEIQAVAKKIEKIKALEAEKERLLSRMKVIQELQKSRPQIVHLFDEIVNAMPANAYMDTLRQTDNNIDLHGRADSNAGVSGLMRNVSASEWLGNPMLNDIKRDDRSDGSGGSNRFNLMIQQKSPSEEEESK